MAFLQMEEDSSDDGGSLRIINMIFVLPPFPFPPGGKLDSLPPWGKACPAKREVGEGGN